MWQAVEASKLPACCKSGEGWGGPLGGKAAAVVFPVGCDLPLELSPPILLSLILLLLLFCPCCIPLVDPSDELEALVAAVV